MGRLALGRRPAHPNSPHGLRLDVLDVEHDGVRDRPNGGQPLANAAEVADRLSPPGVGGVA
jgi:hypothetical protein